MVALPLADCGTQMYTLKNSWESFQFTSKRYRVTVSRDPRGTYAHTSVLGTLR